MFTCEQQESNMSKHWIYLPLRKSDLKIILVGCVLQPKSFFYLPSATKLFNHSVINVKTIYVFDIYRINYDF